MSEHDKTLTDAFKKEVKAQAIQKRISKITEAAKAFKGRKSNKEELLKPTETIDTTDKTKEK